MCCGNGCTSPHRPLVNPGRDGSTAGHLTAVTPVAVDQARPPVGEESRPNGRWWYRSNRKESDVQRDYDGTHTDIPRPNGLQVDQMPGVVPTPATAIRRVAQRDTGAGYGCSS